MLSEDGDWPEGYGRLVRGEVTSTFDVARAALPDLAGPLWILAHRQSAARGRRGRAWLMPEGNFAATLVMRVEEAPGVAALRSFVAALALFDAVSALVGPGRGLALKWPNDVLLNGGKLAGILLESEPGPGGALNLMIGIGVNLAAAPGAEDVEARASRPVSLAGETGHAPAPEAFLGAVAPAYAHWETQFRSFGFEPIRSAWLSRAARLGEVITARTGTREISGTFRDVDIQGQLVLETAKGRVAIPAAEVYF